MQPEQLQIERLPGETTKAYRARCDYLRMGGGRSLAEMSRKYTESVPNSGEEHPPTRSLQVLKRWSGRYGWPAEARRYDEELERYRSERQARTMEEGLAIDAQRVDKLKRLAADLEEQIYRTDERFPPAHPGHRPCIWVRDEKQIGAGENTRSVEIFRYNSAIVSDYRGILDDLARETGGRVHRADVTARGEVVAAINFHLGPDEDDEPDRAGGDGETWGAHHRHHRLN